MTMVFWLLFLWLFFALRWLARCRHRSAFRRRPAAPAKPFTPAPPRRSGGIPKPPWVRDAVLRLAAEGEASCRQVAHAFNRLHAATGMTVGKTYVAKVMVRHRHELDAARRANKNRRPWPSPANRRWGMDCTGNCDGCGHIHAILGLIDHGTRRNLALAALSHANTWTILGHLFLAIGRFGKPRAIRTDNASVFHSRLFQAVLSAAGIRHEFIAPGKPWQNGRIERFFLTLKQKLDLIVPRDRLALDDLLCEFAFWYNAVRPHQHLDGLTPMEAWTRVDPYRTAPRAVLIFSGWGGRLRGFYLRR